MAASLAHLTECIAPELQAVERLFAVEVQSRLECVNVLVRHVSRFRGKMLRPCLVLLGSRAGAA
jgi:octaprenyl-diphosphate synthase